MTHFLRVTRSCTIAVVACVAALRLHATDYYLGSAAASQPGVAVASIAALNALTLHPADRVFFQGGETFNGQIYLGSDDSGTPSSPVAITSFGTGRATISSGTSSALKIYNASGFAVSRIDLVGSGSATSAGSGIDAGVYLADNTRLPYLHFDQMRVSGFKNGVEIWGWYSTSTFAAPGFSDVRLTAIEAFNNRSEGIKTWGSWKSNNGSPLYSHANVYVGHCSVWSNLGDPASTSHTGSGIIISGTDQGTVEYCVAHDNGGYGPATGGGPYGIWAWESRGVTLQYNLVYNQKSSSSLDGGAYDLDGGSSGCAVQYNYSYNNQGPALAVIQFSGASPLVNNTVRYNISENDCRKNAMGAIYVGQFSTAYGINGAEFFGNTIFVSANASGGTPCAAAVQNQSGIANVHLRNNILYATHGGWLIGGATSAPAKALYQGNDYWGGSFDLATFRSYGQESLNGQPTGFRVDPKLNAPGQGGSVTDPAALPIISAYWLQSGSPMTRAGLDLLAAFGVNPGPHDFYGVPIASTSLDVGAAASAVATTSTSAGTSVAVDDEFGGSGSIGGRTPDTVGAGRTWVLEAGAISITGGTAATSGVSRALIDTGLADCTIDSTLNLTTAGTGLVVRSADSANSLRIVLNTTSVQLWKTQNNWSSWVASAGCSLPTGAAYALHVTLKGPTITVAVNGTTVATFNNTFGQTATRHGLLVNGGSGPRSWNNFSVQQ